MESPCLATNAHISSEIRLGECRGQITRKLSTHSRIVKHIWVKTQKQDQSYQVPNTLATPRYKRSLNR